MEKVEKVFEEHRNNIKEVYEEEGLLELMKVLENISDLKKEKDKKKNKMEGFLYSLINILTDRDRITINNDWSIRDDSIYIYNNTDEVDLETFLTDIDNISTVLNYINKDDSDIILDSLDGLIDCKSIEKPELVKRVDSIPKVYEYLDNSNEDIFITRDNDRFNCIKAKSKEEVYERTSFTSFEVKSWRDIKEESELGMYVLYSDTLLDLAKKEEQWLNEYIDRLEDSKDDLEEEYRDMVVVNKL